MVDRRYGGIPGPPAAHAASAAPGHSGGQLCAAEPDDHPPLGFILFKGERTAKVGIKAERKKPAGISIACSKSLPCELRFPWISSQFSRVPSFIGWCRNDPRKPTVIRAAAGIQ